MRLASPRRLSLIHILMDVLNFAHGVLFVLGAYVGLSTFMNPRLLFNTLPFFFVLIAAIAPVSYTHLDVYKRQRLVRL